MPTAGEDYTTARAAIALGDAADDLADMAGAAALAAQGLHLHGGGSPAGMEALIAITCRVRDGAERVAALIGNRAPRWPVQP